MRAIIGMLLFLSMASVSFAAQVNLSVAASMTDAAKELIAIYQKQAPGVSFLPNFASSGALAKQISQGAPVDIFISANPKWMNFLVEEKSIATERVRIFAYNSLVLVGNHDLPLTSIDNICMMQRIAIGSPKSVPAGQYAEQALRNAGLYEQLHGKLIMAKDVRQALIYADRGEVDGAFVYRTDALLAKKAIILLDVPQILYDEVTYPVGLTTDGVTKPEAVEFFDFLKSAQATAILTKFGFVVK